MSSTPTWRPADTAHGSRAFTSVIGDAEVVVVFTGDPTGELSGQWHVRNADDDTFLLGGIDPALAGTLSAVQIYASLMSITSQLVPLLDSDPVVDPAPGVVAYKLVKLAADDTGPMFAQDAEETLAEYAADGWHLVSVDRLWAYLERRSTASPSTHPAVTPARSSAQ